MIAFSKFLVTWLFWERKPFYKTILDIYSFLETSLLQCVHFSVEKQILDDGIFLSILFIFLNTEKLLTPKLCFPLRKMMKNKIN